jgi:FkbM family methyltransferase
MLKNVFQFMGQRIELWTHPEPDHLATVIRRSRGFYEPDLLMKCREIHIPGTVVIDVGANIGNHTVFFGAILGADVEAIEPFPANQQILRMNVAANGLDRRVRVHDKALGERQGQGQALTGNVDNLGTVRIQPGGGGIAITTLDQIAADRPIGLIKIDVEGSEVGVLAGARRTLRQWLPDIMIEADGTDRFQDTARLLHEFGYAARGRYAWTPTYLFSATDQAARMRRLLVPVLAMA